MRLVQLARRRCCRCSRRDLVVRALPARRPDRRDRRLPRGPARGRGRARAARGAAAGSQVGPVDGPDGRVHGLGRDHRARPAARHRRAAPSSAARCTVGLPPRHVRPRRADAPAAPARRARARGRVARRPARRSTQTAFWWEAPDGSRGARRVPLRLVLERARPARRRQAARRRAPATTSRARARAPPRRPAADERHRPPAARNRGSAASSPRRTRSRTTTDSSSRRSPSTCPTQPTDGLATVARRAAFGRAGERAHGRRVEPGRRPPACAAAERSLEKRRRAADRAVPARRRLPARAARPRVAQARR